MFKTAKHIHFVGIGGIGMSALALLLKQQGKTVSGSDQMDSILLDSLRSADIDVHIGHAAEHAAKADLVVYSSAPPQEDPAPAVHPKQWGPVTIFRFTNSSVLMFCIFCAWLNSVRRFIA